MTEKKPTTMALWSFFATYPAQISGTAPPSSSEDPWLLAVLAGQTSLLCFTGEREHAETRYSDDVLL